MSKDKKNVKPEAEDKVKEELDKEFTVSTPSDDNSLGLDREELGDEKYIEALEEKLGQALAESVMCRNLTQRIQADFDNYRKRNASITEEMKQLGQTMVIEKLLTVLDNCDLARKYVKDESALMGFNMMEQQIISALNSFGLAEVDADGKDFDPKLMNALESVKAEGQESKVVEVISKGFTLNGKLLRPAGVKVGK